MDEGTDAREILENKVLPLRRGLYVNYIAILLSNICHVSAFSSVSNKKLKQFNLKF